MPVEKTLLTHHLNVHTLFSPLDDRVIYLFFFVEGGVSIREMQSINKRNVIFILIWGGNYLKSQTIRTDPSNGENRVYEIEL